MKLYTGTNITQEAVERLTRRLTSDLKLPRSITMKDVIAIYSLVANSQFTPKQIHALLPSMTLKKVRTCIHLMLRYGMIQVYKR
jgi:hypothetical protein